MSSIRYVSHAILGGIVALAGLSQAAVAAPCDPGYVHVNHKTVLVVPTGGDDTANLQCALDLGATRGPGVKVQLSEGTFHTAQLVIQGLQGQVQGMGQDRTVIHNLDTRLPIDNPCVNGGPCFADAPPAADNRYPTLISVIGRDVLLSDMTIDIVGTHVVDVWAIWGFPIDAFSEVLQFIGSHASLKVTRMTFTGLPLVQDENGTWGGTAGGVLMWSFSRPWNVTDSTMVVTNSRFNTGGGVNAYNLERSFVFVAGNRVELTDYTVGFVLSDILESSLLFEHNDIVALGTGTIGVMGWPGNLGTGINQAKLLIANNTFSGDVGIQFAPGSFNDVFCLAVNNDMSQVTTPYLFGASTPCRINDGKLKP